MDPTYETTTELLPAAMSNMSYLVAKPEGRRCCAPPRFRRKPICCASPPRR
ncbi:MAG: hypothetical protein L6W00_11350 [Lentisphaeria bacterium]|nr:MAG: hypothetical protein L6W00_11350 [Lentisphaeria bacterium]